jgi:phosphoglycolate phosphatase-like HAD superfamily hydrolase
MILLMFDLDGTLVDSLTIDRLLYARAVTEVLGIERFDTRWTTYRRITNTGILQEISETHRGRPVTAEELVCVEKALLSLFRSVCMGDVGIQAVPGAREFIRRVQNHPSLAVSLATGCWTSTATFKLQSAGFRLHDPTIASSSDADEKQKIMSISEAKALEKEGVKRFESILAFGDGPWDWEAARNLGYRFVGVSNRQLLEQIAEPFVFIDDFTGLEDVEEFVQRATNWPVAPRP